jgi:hypothetical protein
MHCVDCGTSASAERCWECTAKASLARLPADTLLALDESIRRFAFLDALVRVRDGGGPRGIYDAEAVVEVRRRALGLPRYRALPTVETLIEQVRAIGQPPAAVEAYWDGDTNGWFPIVAVLARDVGGSCYRSIVALGVREDGLAGTDDQTRRARALGEALARHFDVAFHFPAEAKPDDTVPRWSDAR